MDFDLFTGLICVLIALSSGFVIYGIAKLTMKGYSSYDDVMASRRQEKSRPASSDRSSEAKKLKKIKKKLKKESLSTGFTSAEDTAQEEEAVPPPQEDVTDAPTVVLIPQKVEEKPATVNKVKQKVKPAKKIEEPTAVAAEVVAAKKVPEVVAKKVPEIVANKKVPEIVANKKVPEIVANKRVPEILSNKKVPEIVAKKVAEVTAEPKADSVQSSPKKEVKISEDNDVSNNSVDEEGSFNNENSGKIKKKIKKKKGEATEDTGKLTLQTLLPMLKQAEFSHGEVQILIDTLLNKDDSEWLKGKQDPMLKLKKQLMEMEKLHSDDTETINGLQVKLATLRSELNSEKVNNKTFRETLVKANADIQSLTVKFQQLSTEKEALHMNVLQLEQQLNEEHLIVHKLQEEKRLYSQMHVSQEQHHEAIAALQSQVTQLTAQLEHEQNLNTTLASETLRFEEEYRQVSALNAEMEQLLSNSQFQITGLNGDLVSMTQQIEGFRAQKEELLAENERLKVEVSKANQDVRIYKKKADTLEHNLEENKKNGNINFHNDHSECQSLLDEKEQTIKNLTVEINQKESVVEKLTNDIINCKNEANKKQTIIENLNVELSSLKSLGAKASSDLSEEKNVTSLLRFNLADKTETINKLTVEIESYKRRNNDLRFKNWKVVEALEKAEASLKHLSLRRSNSPVDDSLVNSMKCRISSVLQPIILSNNFDNISNIEDNDLWLDKLEEILDYINKEPKTDKLLAQNAKLQSIVTHYRSVINDLEQMLLDLELRIESANNSQKSSHPEIDVDD